MAMEWYTAKFRKFIQETPQTRRFFFEVIDRDSYDFTAGQFANFELPIHEEERRRRRSYSIASRPDGGNMLEFVIVYLEGGAGTGFMFNEMEIGFEFPISNPLGKMVLHEPVDHDICFICTGTGIAPFRAMLGDIKANAKPHQKLDMVFGTRTLEDTLYLEEMKALQQELPNFNYHLCLSREEPSDSWEGYKGYVHQIYKDMFKDRHGDEGVKFYICGWKDMVKEARTTLKEMGFDRKQVHVEIFG